MSCQVEHICLVFNDKLFNGIQNRALSNLWHSHYHTSLKAGPQGSSLFCDAQSTMLFAELDLQKAKTFVAGDILPQCEICSINVRVVVSFAAMISGCLTYRKIFREIFNWFLEGTLIVECITNDTRGRSISDFQFFAHFEISIRIVNCFYILTEAVVGFAKGQVALIFALLVCHGCFDNKSYLAAPDRPFILHK